MRSQGRAARAPWLLAGLTALALLVAACGDDAEPAATPEAGSTDEADDPPGTAEGDAAPSDEADPTESSAREPEDAADADGTDTSPVPETLDFTAPSLDGGQVVGSELAGQAVALWFWAPW